MNEKDIVEKTLIACNDVFADIVNVLLFGGERLIKEDELIDAQPNSHYKADGKLREQERDVSKYWKHNNIRITFLGIENQTVSDADMPIRVIGYDGAAYRNQMQKDETERYPVVTLVLYFGYEKRWDTTRHLTECFDTPNELKPYVNDYRINLFEIAYLTDEQVNMFQSDFKIVADYFVQMRKNNDYIPSKEIIRHVHEVMELMSVMNEDNRFEEAYIEEGRETNMCEYLDRLMAKGEARGITIGEARGITIGEARGRIEGTIAAYRKFHMSEEQILAEIMEQFHLEKEDAEQYLLQIPGNI